MQNGYIGIDIGGTYTRGVLWNGKRIMRKKEYRTRNDAPAFSRELRELVKKLEGRSSVSAIASLFALGLGKHKRKALMFHPRSLAIGIGTAGVVKGTKLVMSPNISALRNFDFKRLWPSRDIRVDNDARSFARAEITFGAGKGAESVFALTIGTGVGRAVARGGRIASVKRLEYPERWEGEYQRIRDGKSRAVVAAFLAGKLAPLISSFHSDVVIVGGGLGVKKDFYRVFKRELKNRGVRGDVRVSKLKDAAAIGAAMLWRPRSQ